MGKTIKSLLILLTLTSCFYLTSSLHFELRQAKKRCILEELYLNNMAMIKYSVKGAELGTEEEQKQFYSAINIRVTHVNDNNNIPIDTFIDKAEGKISFMAKTEGQYMVCAFLFPSKWEPNNRVTMSLIIMSDNMDEPNLEKALKQEEVDEIHDKVDEILHKGQRYIDHQNNLIKMEDKDSKSIIKMQKIFYYLTIVQIIIVIGLGIYQIRNLKNYLEENII